MPCRDTPVSIATDQYEQDVARLRQAINDTHSTGTWLTETGRQAMTLPALLDTIKTSAEAYYTAIRYPTLAAMQADLSQPDGKIAYVTSDPDPQNNSRYIKDGASGEGSWIMADDGLAENNAAIRMLTYFISTLSLYPNQSSLNADGVPLAFAVLDAVGRLGLGVTSDGGAMMANIVVHTHADQAADPFCIADKEGSVAVSIDASGNATLGQTTFATVIDDNSPYAFCIADLKGRVAFAIRKDGSMVGMNNEVERPALAIPKTGYIHNFIYGQSNSRGPRANIIISTMQIYSNVMLSPTVMTRPMDQGYDGGAYLPLVEGETYPGSGVYCETPTSGSINELTRRIHAAGDQETWRFIGSCAGEGGTRIAELSKGTVWYAGMLQEIKDAMNIAALEGESYSVWSLVYIQGEGDAGKTVDYYKGMLAQLVQDFCMDVVGITRQPIPPKCFITQVCNHRRYDKANNPISIAQWQAANENDAITLVCPMYCLPHSTDTLHLSSEGSYLMAVYFGKAMYQTFYLGKRFKPLQPEAIIWQGRVIDITFHVPVGRLVFDTSFVAETPNMGFNIWLQNENISDDMAITEVSIASQNRIRILLSRDPSANDLFTYGRGRTGDPHTGGPLTGPRGNLRDQAGDLDNYINLNGQIQYMHNYCVMFQQAYAI